MERLTFCTKFYENPVINKEVIVLKSLIVCQSPKRGYESKMWL